MVYVIIISKYTQILYSVIAYCLVILYKSNYTKLLFCIIGTVNNRLYAYIETKLEEYNMIYKIWIFVV